MPQIGKPEEEKKRVKESKSPRRVPLSTFKTSTRYRSSKKNSEIRRKGREKPITEGASEEREGSGRRKNM